MTDVEAEQILTAGLTGYGRTALEGSGLEATGRWPVLLALINGFLRAEQEGGRPIDDALREIFDELRRRGPSILDAADPGNRHGAVATTIQASLDRLTPDQRARYLELAAFGQVLTIPGPALEQLWKTTARWSAFQTHQFCRQHGDLALVAEYRRDPDRVRLHGVVRAHLSRQAAGRDAGPFRTPTVAHPGVLPTVEDENVW
jgi:hypothetical protein